MNKAISSRTFVFAISSAAVCLCSALILFPKISTTTFQGDESGWIASAYYYTELVSAGDFDRAKWDKPELGSFGSLNMHLGQWLIGIALEADGTSRAGFYSGIYNFDAPFYENLREGRVPPWESLGRARGASAWFGVMCCFLMFAIGYVSFDVWIGLIAAALLMWSEAFRALSTQAMTDVFYLFFLLCGCLAIFFFSKATSRKRALCLAAICGLLAGLACSVKITGLVIVGATFLLALIQRDGFRVQGRQWKEIVAMAGIFSCCALLTVYSLNPYFWPSWKAIHARSVPHEMRMMLEEKMAAGSGHANGRYPDLRELARPLEFPRMYRRWKTLMKGQQSISEWRHNRLFDIHARLMSYRLNPPGEFIFVGIGVVVLLWKRLARYLPTADRSQNIPLFYLFVNYSFVLIFIQLNWIRYYLPTMVAAHLIAAVGIYAVLSYSHHALPKLVKWGSLARHPSESEARAGQ